MKRKISLSDKRIINPLNKTDAVYLEKDVKKSISTLKERIENWDVEPCCHGIKQEELLKEIDDIMGSELI